MTARWISAGIAAIAACVFLASCTTEPPAPPEGLRFEKADFRSLPAIPAADWQSALSAFVKTCPRLSRDAEWRDACMAAAATAPGDAGRFFAEWMDLWRVLDSGGDGLMTGYYEPVLRGSRTRHGIYQTPVLGVPADLLTVELTSLHPKLKGLNLRGRVLGNRVVPYDDRSEIVRRPDLDACAICWVDDPVEAFFLQVQGSGRVTLEEGGSLRVGYADQNGHPYRPIGRWLAGNAGIPLSEMSMQRIKRWVRENPERCDELLNYNANYVFFAERTGFAESDGPLGAAGVPLTAMSSVAVDRRFWKLGVPFVVAADQDRPALHFVRPVVAQDTGGAIRGPLRFDFYWGGGDAAGERAGRQKSRARAWLMVPRDTDPARAKSQP